VPALHLYERITSFVDEVMASQVRDAVAIWRGFNEELDKSKSAFYSLCDMLSSVGAQVLDKYLELRHIKVIFLPQVGFLIKLDRRHHACNKVMNEFTNLPKTFFFVFQQSGDAYFKNEDRRQLDEEIGDLESIKDTENLIKSELEDNILYCEGELRSAFSAIA
jgi:DNA mismatch repair ATPase MutS